MDGSRTHQANMQWFYTLDHRYGASHINNQIQKNDKRGQKKGWLWCLHVSKRQESVITAS